MNRHQLHTSQVERCPTKIPLTRDAAIAEADRLGWPVTPYKCSQRVITVNQQSVESLHWHVGTNRRVAPVFHNDRERWYRQARNRE